GGGGGRGGGGRGGQQGGRGGRGRGPFNGQFAAFGNRRRVQPAYTGSLAITSSNSVLNAAPFSLNGQSVPKPYMQRETIAFNVGGPVRIPKLVTNDKWFVYLTLQDARNRNGRESVSTVPTVAERNGDFSGATVNNNLMTIYDPLSASPFPGNMIPTNRFNPASVALLQYFPLPVYSGIIQNYSISPSPPSSTNAVGVRLYGPVTPKDNLNFNVQYSGNSATTEQLFGFKDTSSGYGLSSTAGYRHVFRPRLNNNAVLAFSRSQSTGSPFFAYKENIASQLGITGTDQTPIDYGPPNLSFTNFGGLTDGTASVTRAQTTNFTDTVTWVYKRKHNVTFGFGYRRMQNNALSYAGSRGAFNFGGLLTSGFNPDGTTIPNTGFDFADFLLGYPQTSTRRIGNSNNYFRGQAYNWYAQDDFRASARLTLNLGLRYEYFTPYTELQGHLANLDVNPTLTAVSVVTAQNAGGPYTGQFPAALVNPDRNNYSPRLGFAWRPSAKNSRLIRGGYSIFFSGSAYSQIATTLAAQPPFANSASLSTSLTAPLTMQNGFPLVGANTIANTFAIDKNYKLAYAQTWSLALQQTLPQNLLLEVEYIGTKGTGLNLLYVPNELPPNSPLSATANRSTTAFTYLTDHADSIFHAGQVRLTRRFARGMSAVALYTLSKSIDDASTFSGGTNGTVIQDPNNFSADRGLSSFDQRHNFTLTYLLSSPVGIHGLFRNGGWKTKAFSGWTLNGTFNAHSGNPLTALISGNLAKGAVLGQLRAEATGLPVSGGLNPFFNTAAFELPPAGEFGDAGRNTITGPATASLNGSLNRAFRFGETRRQVQLRLNATNMLNHVQITGFGTTFNTSTYGLATAASATRSVSLLLRLNF
ncbi:MAG: TonB-dependent receptor, partial [Candidatus Sulfopaludibacter sp.]|nr:TonB-dependent receptor [Candidatus Sulfopaludibacter sp.]